MISRKIQNAGKQRTNTCLARRSLWRPFWYEKQRERTLYLPSGEWRGLQDGRLYQGGCTVTCDAPVDAIPVFVKKGCLEELTF